MPGAVHVFDLVAGTSWTAVNPDPTNGQFGAAVAALGTDLFVGAVGSIYVFGASNGQLAQTLSLNGIGNVAVTLAAANAGLVVGDTTASQRSIRSGTAHLFKQSASTQLGSSHDAGEK